MNELDLAIWLHDNYEEISEEVGWETQEDCRTDFLSLPSKNQTVMLRLARRIKERFVEK